MIETLCRECGVEHEPEFPHDNNSQLYQLLFRERHGRFPTWDDAMSHCKEEVKIRWKETMERVKKNTKELDPDLWEVK